MSPATVDVVVCTYTLERIDLLRRCVLAVGEQLRATDRLHVVVDADDAVVQACRQALPRVDVVPNERTTGLSGARNTGVLAGDGDVVAFIDDDAVPREGWLDALRRRFDDPDVAIVGGRVEADWAGIGGAPPWFPPEFGWVVGCDYLGMPGDGQSIRNPIGANMAIRRSVFAAAGLFDEEFGRLGSGYAGCEETELSLRAAAAVPGSRIVRDESATVDHLVPGSRQRVGHLLRRCFDEGRSKSQLATTAGPKRALSSELRHAGSTLPRAWWSTLRSGQPTRAGAAGRAATSVAGLAATAAGFATATVGSAARRRRPR